MKKFGILAILALVCCGTLLTAQRLNLAQLTPIDRSFTLVSASQAATLLIDPSEELVVHKAAEMLRKDILEITGKDLQTGTSYNKKKTGPKIIVATLGAGGKKSLFNTVNKIMKEDFSDLEGKWESFRIQTARLNGEKVLLVVGSDRRGTAYGLLEISRMIGVSPWTWWADVHPEKKTTLTLADPYTDMPSPSVKYRGIFINDEDWGMHPWAGKNYEPEVGDMGPRTYARIFELLLRLRANTIWPAMHECSKPFFTVPGNLQVADTFAIMISNSHCEPMLRTNTGEWDTKTLGPYNYFTNKERVLKYWEDRIVEAGHNENIYTIGMRGIHDGRMEGASNVTEYLNGLRQVIKDQRDILTRHIDSDITRIHQIFIPYKEVLEVYDAGLEVPDDVTLIWCDDNYGYIRRLSNAEEQKRSGGSGVYYHVSYWGRPHDYLWISSTQPAVAWLELQRAYEYGARQMWIINVGDIKPAEYLTEMCMDMAWNIKSIQTGATKGHLEAWMKRTFGDNPGEQLAEAMNKYYELAFIRRPEFMGWSQTEPTTQVRDSEFNPFEMGDEIATRLEAYRKLDSTVQALASKVPARLQDAYFELVEYPVRGAALMNAKHLNAQMARLLQTHQIKAAEKYAEKSTQAYQEIVSLTERYNKATAGGKWDNMMSMAPRNLPVFAPAPLPSSFEATDSPKLWFEGESAPSVPYSTRNKIGTTSFMILDRADKFVRIYDAPSVSWITKPEWLMLLPDETNEEHPDERVYRFSLDERKMTEAMEGGLVEVKAGNSTFRIAVEGIRPPLQQDAFERDQAVVIPVEDNLQRNTNPLRWRELPGLGYSGRAMTIFPLQYTLQDDPTKNPYLEYTFYSTSSGVADLRVYFLPTHPADGKSDLRYAVQIDGDALQTASIRTYDRDDRWKANVLRNQAIGTTQHVLAPGKHILRIYPVDPGLVLDQIMVDFKKNRKFYIVPNNL